MRMKKKQILQLLKTFKENNAEKYCILSLGIFGSVASDTTNSDSDIDIVVETSKIDLFLLVHIKEELENIFKKKVDIVRYRERMNHFLKKHIDEEAVYV